jgi:hypothetical protein
MIYLNKYLKKNLTITINVIKFMETSRVQTEWLSWLLMSGFYSVLILPFDYKIPCYMLHLAIIMSILHDYLIHFISMWVLHN